MSAGWLTPPDFPARSFLLPGGAITSSIWSTIDRALASSLRIFFWGGASEAARVLVDSLANLVKALAFALVFPLLVAPELVGLKVTSPS